ncbi:methyltransferase [Mongoliitalea daihaiensis]|uniref:methyltransferase n=1 Tax=Mongoliitalea daihaiensis TaxID=2782006 RepID=UPI001F1DED20|nr:methyltransferase [Mongoliitalea daihaiensis]UJP65947.1 methyltransferase [Mongoliitalea daihaiensis]
MSPNPLQVHRPEPIHEGDEILSYTRKSDIQETIQILLSGKQVLVEEYYSNGLDLLKELSSYLKKSLPNQSFLEQRAYRTEFRNLSNRILLRIKEHQLQVKKAPEIGWLAKLYPELSDFYLPFPQVQGLNSAWQWYTNGIQIPGLRNKIHPYYGVYFPTRFEHVLVFDNWLKRYQGPKKSAIDVGVGSGILSLLMVQHGFQKVFGTDINANAIIGLTESMGDTKLSRKIELDFGHLFGKWVKPTELIVFNPPWLPTSKESNKLDEAIYYNEQLFPDFFAGAHERLLSEGHLLIIFSNLAQITGVTDKHPIEQELLIGGRFVLERCLKKSVKEASQKTQRNQHWRGEEVVELWVLKKL